MADIRSIVDSIRSSQDITPAQLEAVLATGDRDGVEYLRSSAREVAQEIYGNKVFLRGLIEFSSHCRNDCRYCGIRRSNTVLRRYRLDRDTILQCCRMGYGCGLRTFVLQSGEDPYFNDERMCGLIAEIRAGFPDCAITLSIGERSRESYRLMYEAGADRYLLRHETADRAHYARLHPEEMSFDNRMRCLRDLKEIGYQVGCGFMVGSPGQTAATLFEDLQFIRSFRPHMCGIGPFVATAHTPFAEEPDGSVQTTLRLLSLIRLIHPRVLLPATTALGTLNPLGREQGILSGANVVMPNLSPVESRKLYNIYDNKICLGDDIAHCRSCLQGRIRSVGYEVVEERGDYRAEAGSSCFSRK